MTPAERLEATQHDLFWLPQDATVLRREGLLAVSSPRPLPHLNMGLNARLPEAELSAGLAEATSRFAPQSGRWFVPDTYDTGPLERDLEAMGWAPAFSYEARALRPDAYDVRPATEAVVRRVETVAGLRDMATVAQSAFGAPRRESDEALEASLPHCVGPEARSRRYVAYRDGEAVSSGGMNVYPDLSAGFLWAGATVAHARGQGFYRDLLAARIADARQLGLEWVGLYARDETSAPIVAAQGFERIGTMRYFKAPGAELPTG